MLNCREQKAVGSGQKAACVARRVLVFCLLPTAYCLLFSGCRRDMQDQPKAIAYRQNCFYKDGTGSRALVEGTVPRGFLREDRALYFGKKSGTGGASVSANAQSPVVPATAQGTAPAANTNSANALYPDDVDTFP